MTVPSTETAKKLPDWAGKSPINTTPKPESKVEPKVEQKSDLKPDLKPDVKAEAPKPVAPEAQICPNCHKNYRVGELVCPHCAFVFDRSGRTGFVGNSVLPHPKSMPTGEVSLPDQMPITLEIEGKTISLPPREILIVGRQSQVAGDVQPDVSLSEFEAETHGVSRQHVRIKRKGGLIYVTDLGSTNGTYLNGRKMMAQGERLLRSGDEIHLGRLKVIVRF